MHRPVAHRRNPTCHAPRALLAAEVGRSRSLGRYGLDAVPRRGEEEAGDRTQPRHSSRETNRMQCKRKALSVLAVSSAFGLMVALSAPAFAQSGQSTDNGSNSPT